MGYIGMKGYILGLYRDNGTEKTNYYLGFRVSQGYIMDIPPQVSKSWTNHNKSISICTTLNLTRFSDKLSWEIPGSTPRDQIWIASRNPQAAALGSDLNAWGFPKL